MGSELHSAQSKTIIGVLGNIVGVAVNLAPMATFYNIFRKKSTMGFSGLPYVFSLSSALLWVVYGNPQVTQHAIFLITINVSSSCIQIFYLTVFFTYGAKGPRRHVLKALLACLTSLGIVSVVTLAILKHPKTRAKFVGSLCIVIGVITYAAPLSVARMVVATGSVEFLPITLCSALFLNSTIWTGYGFITNDIFVLVPNGLGVALGATQLSLYLFYRKSTTSLKELPTKQKELPMKQKELPMKQKELPTKDVPTKQKATPLKQSSLFRFFKKAIPNPPKNTGDTLVSVDISMKKRSFDRRGTAGDISVGITMRESLRSEGSLSPSPVPSPENGNREAGVGLKVDISMHTGPAERPNSKLQPPSVPSPDNGSLQRPSVPSLENGNHEIPFVPSPESGDLKTPSVPSPENGNIQSPPSPSDTVSPQRTSRSSLSV